MKILKTIPHHHLAEWNQIPIFECNEKLVPLSALSKKTILRLEPMYFQQKIPGALPECFVRENLANKIEQASKLLPKGLIFVVWDAWRPFAVQKALFNAFKDRIKVENPSINEEDLIKQTSVYVSLPSQDLLRPSPHNTGGAIDLSIAKEDDGVLEMGTDFDDFTERASTAYYELQRNQKKSDHSIIIRENRRLLYTIMTSVGFTNYPEEWWHFDFGNQFWASLSKQPYAVYGMTNPQSE